MTNVLALCFVMTTLVTAGVFSPSPERRHKDETTVVKEGHRVVVVEFDKDDGNTKISISPQEQKGQKLSDEPTDGTKEKLKREGIPHSHRWSAKDLVCDAFGKCKHKIDSAVGRTKEAVSEAVDKANEEAHGAKERAKDVGSELSSKVKEKAHQVQEAADKGGEEAHWVKERAKDVGSDLSGKVKEKAHQVKEGVKREGEKAMDTAKTIKGDAERNSSRKIEATIEKAKEAKEMVEEKVKEERKNGFVYDVLAHSLWLKSMGILHLLGFATAYGMCVWVTFVSSYVLASSLARQQFATVQSKIYPVYFKAMAYSVGTALIGYLMSRGMKTSKIVMLQGFYLLAPFLVIMVNMLYLEPQATKVMFERMKKEKEDGRAKEGSTAKPSSTVIGTVPDSAIRGTNGEKSTLSPDPGQERLKEAAVMRSRIVVLREKLKRLNTYSSFLNVVTLMFLTCHLVHLGHQLNTVC